MQESSAQSYPLVDWLVNRRAPQEQEGLQSFFNQLCHTGEVQLSSLDLIILLNLVKGAQALRLPDPNTGRKPAGVFDPSTGERDRTVPAHESWMTPQLAAHYLQYAASIYGSSDIYGLKDSGAFFTWIGNIFRRPIQGRPSNIEFDETLENYEIIKRVTNLRDEDLIYLTYENDLVKKPFMITLDHEQKSILVTVRGSHSKIDWDTDFMMTPSQPIAIGESEEVNEANFVHEGMLKAAEHLKSRLLGDYVPDEDKGKEVQNYQTSLLARAIHQLQNSVDRFGKKIGKKGAMDYRLVITGHSLGAGVAAILTVLLRKEFPDIRCFAFSPPGCLMSESVANYCSTFVLSVTLGDDGVARTGVCTALDLKIKIFKTLQEHQDIALRSFVVKETTEDEKLMIDKIISDTEKQLKDTPKLFLPGSIMYLEEIQGTSWFGSRTYSQHFCNRRDEIFSEILLSEHIVGHHIPWRLLDGLKYVSRP